MSAGSATVTVAIYWDFENVHASLYDDRNGNSAYRQSKFQKQPELIKLAPVIDFIVGMGDIAIHRAYADWSTLRSYRNQLLDHSIDLIQLFPRGAKNGADIRIVLDAMEDVQYFSHITHVVIVGGDSDYVGLAQKLRQAGKVVTGIGVRGFTNDYWVRACNDFRYYDAIVASVSEDGESALAITALKAAAGSDLEDAKDMIRRVLQSETDKGNTWTFTAALGSRLRRMNPTFDAMNFGYRSLSQLVAACGSDFKLKRGEHDFLVALAGSVATREPLAARPRGQYNSSKTVAVQPAKVPPQPSASAPSTPQTAPPAAIDAREGAVANESIGSEYRRVLKAQGLRIPDPTYRASIVVALVNAFKARPLFDSWTSIDVAVAEELAASHIECPREQCRVLRELCYRCHLFTLEPNRGGIGLTADVPAINEIIDQRIAFTILRQCDPPLDADALRDLLYEPGTQLSQRMLRIVHGDDDPPATDPGS